MEGKKDEFITGSGGLLPTAVLLLFKGTISFSSSSIGSPYGASFHQTAPFPSIVPLPLTVIPTSFVNSSHCKSPEPQYFAFVGAIIVPSNCKNQKRFQISLLSKKKIKPPVLESSTVFCPFFFSQVLFLPWKEKKEGKKNPPLFDDGDRVVGGGWGEGDEQNINYKLLPIQQKQNYDTIVFYLENNIVLTVWSWEWYWTHKKFIFWWDQYCWGFNFTSCCPCCLKGL